MILERRGLGIGVPQISAIGTQAANTGIAFSKANSGSGYITAAGSALLTGAMIPSPAAPFLAIAGGIAELLGSIGIGRGCGQTCIQASQYADQAEGYLKQNYATYFSLPSPRTASQKAAALALFDEIWNGLVQACNNPALGTAGANCIGDRKAGACKWKQTADSPLLGHPGEPAPGECWNWFSGYRDPIDQDPVVPDAQAAAGNFVSQINSPGSLLPLLLAAGLVAVVVLS